MKASSPLESRIRALALAYPEATEHFPWGERAIKVKGKVFLFMHGERDRISLSVKLPSTHFQAIALPFTEPTGYGLGRSDWVTAKFSSSADMLDQCREWLDESYRAVAPKKLVSTLDAPPSGAAPKTPAPRKRKTTSPRRR